MGRGLVLKGQKLVEDIDRQLLRSGQEAPGMSAACIGDKAVRIVAIFAIERHDSCLSRVGMSRMR
jgi:hypothetical protein